LRRAEKLTKAGGVRNPATRGPRPAPLVPV
jgi:hypothetical protein